MKKILTILATVIPAVALSADLVVYTPQADAKRRPFIKEQARKALGIDIEFVSAGGGVLHDRVVAEGKNPQADVIMGLTQSGMYSLQMKGLLQPYSPTWKQGLPKAYQTADDSFTMFWQTPIVIAYSPKCLPANKVPPTTWTDLIKPEYKDMYAIGGLGSQTTRSYLAGILSQYRDGNNVTDAGWDTMKKFYANSITDKEFVDIVKGWGDCSIPIMLNWFGGVFRVADSSGMEFKIVNTKGGTPVIAEGIGIIKGTDNLSLAQKFVDWWGSPTFMAKYANTFGQTPAHPEAIANSNDKIKAYAKMVTAQPVDWLWVTENQSDWLETIELDIME